MVGMHAPSKVAVEGEVVVDDEVDTPLSEDAVKAGKLAKQRSDLLKALDGGDFSSVTTKVAFVLNQYPDARNSDVTLAIRYWGTFQPDIYNENGIRPRDLFKLERYNYLSRARAKIQNEFQLFIADDKIRRRRREHEDEIKDDVRSDVEPRSTVNVFADESGKTAKFLIISSVWALRGRAVFDVGKAIEAWQVNSPWHKREMHFNKIGKQEIEPLRQYLKVVLENSEYLSFKSVAFDRTDSKRKVEDLVSRLHEEMLTRGASHEQGTGRIALPRAMVVTLDHENSLDQFALKDMRTRINTDFVDNWGVGEHGRPQLHIERITTISSRESKFIQLADLIGGAINRRLNGDGGTGHKDEAADMIIGMLGIHLSQSDIGWADSSALFSV